MCAIAGIVELQFDSDLSQKMLNTMKHRGPDAFGCFFDEKCCLLHSRLAVVDLQGGSQPMELEWDGNYYVITYNGELYNTHELRMELIKLGHRFEGYSDTEVVLHAYAQWQEASLHKFNGIFAFGIWEKRCERLFIARDRIGVKPLFFARHRTGILFASEMKTILSYPGFEARLAADGVAQLLLLGPGRLPGSGVISGIQELEPGSFAKYEKGKLSITNYWSLKDREHTESFQETAEHVRWLVLDAIKRQMVSDVPVGTFLSGGLDSSLITAICASEKMKNKEYLHTFSVDYQNNDRYFVSSKFQPESDKHYINIMEEKFETTGHHVELTADDLLSSLEAATFARDLPGMADVDSSLLSFCGKIKNYVTVALSGECADEIFGGYPWYRDPEIRNSAGFPWAQNTALRAGLLHPQFAAEIDAVDYVHSAYMQTITSSDILPNTDSVNQRMKEMTNLNFRWFMQTLLDRKDRMSMYHGLEVRVPFCDYRIAEYLYGVPWEYKDYNHVEKGLLRKAMYGILPEQVLWRKKSPYPKTYDPRYGNLVKKQLERILSDVSQPVHQVMNVQQLNSLVNDELDWPWYGQLMKLPQMMAYVLQINMWMQMYHVKIA